MAITIFDALRESHAIQRSLSRRLRLSVPGPRRNELFRTLWIELAAHEAAEERYLYCELLLDDRGLHASRDALADHHKMDEIVETLKSRDPDARGWMNTVKKLSKELHDHLREEERIFFQLAGKILTKLQKRTLAIRYRRNYLVMHAKYEDESR
jgi:hemerythrin superfamily protein